MVSIPASAIVNVLPSVISAGGSALDIIGLILTQSARVPIGSIRSFSSAADVSDYFGPSSTESGLAQTYFAGYDGSSAKPASLLFSQYADAAVAAWLRGGTLANVTLTQLQGMSGTLTISVAGSAKTSSAIDLSAATSFSNAAALIEAAFTSPGFTVAYDSISAAFVVTTSDTGADATLSVATGTLAAGIKLTGETGAILSQGSDAMTPAEAMADIVAETQDWVTFMTTWLPSDDNMDAFAAWVDAQKNRYAYVAWDNDASATTNGDTSSFGPRVKAAGYSSVVAIYDPNSGANIAAFLLGAIASLNFNEQNGRATMAFRSGTVVPGVTNETAAANLEANGYNFVGSYATANDGFIFFYPGQISGDFSWIDSWVSQVWLNNNLQLALMNLLTAVGSVPYNAQGYALIEAAMADPVQRALNFGAIRAGVTLSSAQAAEINNAAGGQVSDTVQQRGWFIKIADPGAEVRAERGSPIIHLWYADGGAVQKITLSSVMVQ